MNSRYTGCFKDNLIKKIPFLVLILFLINTNIFAQDYVINETETWSSNQTINTNIIVGSGGVLTIDGIDVLVHYVDLDGDNTGDITITVQDGGALIINSGTKFTRAGVNAPSGYENKHWEGIIIESDNGSNSFEDFTIEYANTALRINKADAASPLTFGAAAEVITFNDCNNAIKVDAFGSDLTFNDVDINNANITNNAGNGVEIQSSGDVTFTNGPAIDDLGGNAVDITAADITFSTAFALNNIGGNAFTLTGDVIDLPAITLATVGGNGISIESDNVTFNAAPNLSDVTGNGIALTGDNLTLDSPVLTNVDGDGITITGAAPSLTSANLSGTGQNGIKLVGSSATLSNASLTTTTDTAIVIVGNSATITSPTVNGVTNGDGISVDGDDLSLTSADIDDVDNGKGILINGNSASITDPTLDNITLGAAIEVVGNGLELTGATITTAGQGIVSDGNNTQIYFGDLTTITNEGIKIGAASDGVTLDWLNIDAAGTGIYNEGINIDLDNTQVTNGTKSGFFNLGGIVTIDNCLFNDNAFHGIVNAGGPLHVNNVDLLRNENGFVAAGNDSTVVSKTTMSNNNLYGFEITGAELTEDLKDITDGDTDHPKVKVNFSNITTNSTKIDTIQVKNSADASSIAEFNANWWGTDGSTVAVSGLIEADYAGSVDFKNYRMGGSFTGAHSDFTASKSLSYDNIYNNQTVVQGEEFTVNWSTVGDVPNVKVIITGGATTTIPNTGTYSWTVGAGETAIEIQDDNDATVTTTAYLLNNIAAGSVNLDYPNGGETFTGGNTVTVKWGLVPSTSTLMTIAYSDDNGGTWTDVEQVSASLGEYEWTVPNAATAQGLIRITDEDALTDDADAVFTVVPAPPSSSGEDWAYSNTGVNMQIHFEDVDIIDDADATIVAQGTDPGSAGEAIYVGAFYLDEDGNPKCAGFSQVGGTNDLTDDDPVHGNEGDDEITITVWGDDPNTAERDGVPSGSDVMFKIWREAWDVNDPDNDGGNALSREASVIDAGVAGNIPFAANGVVTKDAVQYKRGATAPGATLHEITTTDQWMLISSYINPATKTIDHSAATNNGSLLAESADGSSQGLVDNGGGVFSDFTILKDGDGNVHWDLDPAATFDIVGNLSTWDPTKGYQLKMQNAGALVRIVGTQIYPQSFDIPLSEGWNLIPYVRKTDKAIEQCLSSIAQSLSIVKDASGSVYWPKYSINDIGDMVVGEAYWVKVDESITLNYPVNSPKTKAVEDQEIDNKHFIVDFNSDNSSIVGIMSSAFSERLVVGDEIGFFSPRGKLVGSTVYDGNNIAAVIWGQESGSEDAPGMRAGEQYEIRVWNKTAKDEQILTDIEYVEGGSLYKPDAISMISSVGNIESSVPVEYSLDQNYPNPFNPSTTIKFALPNASKVNLAIYNVLGEKVSTLISNQSMEAGRHKVNFNAMNLSSGIYFYRIETPSFVETRKMNLLK